jgi:hypothetical protein
VVAVRGDEVQTENPFRRAFISSRLQPFCHRIVNIPLDESFKHDILVAAVCFSAISYLTEPFNAAAARQNPITRKLNFPQHKSVASFRPPRPSRFINSHDELPIRSRDEKVAEKIVAFARRDQQKKSLRRKTRRVSRRSKMVLKFLSVFLSPLWVFSSSFSVSVIFFSSHFFMFIVCEARGIIKVAAASLISC